MERRRSFVVLLGMPLLAAGLVGCASKAPQEKSAADAMSTQRSASAMNDPRACYDEFGYRRADAPYGFCQNQPQYYVVEERRPAPQEQATTTATPSGPVQGVVNSDPVRSVTQSVPVRSVVRPVVRSQPLPRPDTGVMRLPVPVGGGMGVLR